MGGAVGERAAYDLERVQIDARCSLCWPQMSHRARRAIETFCDEEVAITPQSRCLNGVLCLSRGLPSGLATRARTHANMHTRMVDGRRLVAVDWRRQDKTYHVPRALNAAHMCTVHIHIVHTM